MIGLSLSACVADIAKGVVQYRDVEKIISGTCAQNDDEFDALCLRLSKQSHTIWYGVDGCIEIARRLWDEGKIVQPRLDHLPPPSIAKVRWVNDMEAVVWEN